MSHFSLKKTLLAACLISSIFPAELEAQELLASLWELPQLYENKDNAIVQKFDLIGRYHGQYWWADSEGNKEQDWENRRMYLGFNTKLFNNFKVEVQVSINDDFDPVYKGLYDAFIQWKKEDFAVSVGRLDYVYTGMERSTSSKRIKTMERALLVNQVMPGEVIGLYITDKVGELSYQTGLFSGSIKQEFTDFEGGFGALLGLNYPMHLFYDTGSLHLDYLYNNGNADNNAFKPYENIISLWHEGTIDAFAFGIDCTMATGVGAKSDVFGLTLLPTYDVAHNLLLNDDKLQVTMRYHYASSSDDYSLDFAKRYEQPVTTGKGDSYNALYLGLNYYLYQQKLKLMGGVEYFEMNGVADTEEVEFNGINRSVNGWNIITGIRLYF